MKARTGFTILLVPILFGCGGEDGAAETSAKDPVAVADAATDSSSQADRLEACEYLSAALVSSEFGVAEKDLRTSMNDEKYCGFKWDKTNSEEINRENIALMMKQTQERVSGADVTPFVRRSSENSVNISLAPPFTNVANATSGFAGMKRRLSEGITVAVDEDIREKARAEASAATGGMKSADDVAFPDSVTFQADTGSLIEGIGDQAFWSSDMSQLSVRRGASIFHLGVRVEEDDAANFEIAKELARKIADRM